MHTLWNAKEILRTTMSLEGMKEGFPTSPMLMIDVFPLFDAKMDPPYPMSVVMDGLVRGVGFEPTKAYATG